MFNLLSLFNLGKFDPTQIAAALDSLTEQLNQFATQVKTLTDSEKKAIDAFNAATDAAVGAGVLPFQTIIQRIAGLKNFIDNLKQQ